MRKFVFFDQRQRIHVGPQTDGPRTAAFAQAADHTGGGQPAMHLKTIGRQLASNDVGGARFIECQFGVRMDVAAYRHKVCDKGDVEDVHVFLFPKLSLPVYSSPACRWKSRSAMLRRMHLVLISGLSGSGKSIALNVLEDAGYYCVDNLPSLLLQQLVGQLDQQGYSKVAVAIDIRGGESVTMLPQQLDALRANDLDLQLLFLDAKDETLLKRFSETRRRHPLASNDRTLSEAIVEERVRLEALVELGHHLDTSDVRPNTLREWVRQFIAAEPGQGLTLLFESFGFKHGVPLDADLVFDVRCLPNPHYEMALRPLTGRDAPVRAFLEAESEVIRMRDDIARFIASWLPAYIRDSRSYLTVAVGCTGGQHRSVYLAEWLAQQFRAEARVLVRHREIQAGPRA